MQCYSCSFVGKSFKVDQNRAPHQETGYLGSIVTRVKAFLLIGRTTGLKDPTSLRASQWPLGRNLKSQCRLRHMRRAIARARLCARLKDWRRAREDLIKKASRCAADRTSKTTASVKHKHLTRKLSVFICYFIGSVMKIVLSEAATGGVVYKKVFLKFVKFTGKYKCQSLFFNKFAGTATSLLIVLTWKSLNIVYRKLMKFFKVLPKENLKSACKR